MAATKELDAESRKEPKPLKDVLASNSEKIESAGGDVSTLYVYTLGEPCWIS